MLVAIVQTVRIVLAIIERKLQEAKELNDQAKCMFRMAQCCLGCLEWCVKYINKNAYIVQAITGQSFFPAAMRGLEMIGNNVMTVGMISIISEYVILFGKLMVTVSTVILSYLIMKGAGATDGITQGVLLLFIIAVLIFLIVSLFANIFSVCIDTMLICYCYDKDEPGFNYFPEDLDAYVKAVAATKKGSVDKGRDTTAQAEKAEPLKPVDAGAAGGGIVL
jgi:choline transporter-like protein 2/4/5